MRVFFKCQYCGHATGSRISIDDVSKSWQQLSRWIHHELPYKVELTRGERPDAYHLECKEVYDFWYREAFSHKLHCHLENCPHSHPYPFRRFSLPLSLHSPTSPTTLGEPKPIPEEVERLLRL